MEKTITKEQAISEGYKLACSEDGTLSIPLLELDEDDLNTPMYLGSKETFGFSISEADIIDAIQGVIDGQEEVNNEDDHLSDELAEVDCKAMAEIANKAFNREYHSVTDIMIVKS